LILKTLDLVKFTPTHSRSEECHGTVLSEVVAYFYLNRARRNATSSATTSFSLYDAVQTQQRNVISEESVLQERKVFQGGE
jgi:hypothetical protein